MAQAWDTVSGTNGTLEHQKNQRSRAIEQSASRMANQVDDRSHSHTSSFFWRISEYDMKTLYGGVYA